MRKPNVKRRRKPDVKPPKEKTLKELMRPWEFPASRPERTVRLEREPFEPDWKAIVGRDDDPF